jgi:hypothetical protein
MVYIVRNNLSVPVFVFVFVLVSGFGSNVGFGSGRCSVSNPFAFQTSVSVSGRCSVSNPFAFQTSVSVRDVVFVSGRRFCFGTSFLFRDAHVGAPLRGRPVIRTWASRYPLSQNIYIRYHKTFISVITKRNCPLSIL